MAVIHQSGSEEGGETGGGLREVDFPVGGGKGGLFLRRGHGLGMRLRRDLFHPFRGFHVFLLGHQTLMNY